MLLGSIVSILTGVVAMVLLTLVFVMGGVRDFSSREYRLRLRHRLRRAARCLLQPQVFERARLDDPGLQKSPNPKNREKTESSIVLVAGLGAWERWKHVSLHQIVLLSDFCGQ
jgi:hypothetical protein